jgi:hypothetical protein
MWYARNVKTNNVEAFETYGDAWKAVGSRHNADGVGELPVHVDGPGRTVAMTAFENDDESTEMVEYEVTDYMPRRGRVGSYSR